MNAMRELSIPNPLLEPLSILIGTWNTVGKHPLLPEITLHGQTSFEWLEGGAFLIMHSGIEEPGIPTGIGIFGSDDSAGERFMLYFDERGVSRKYEVAIHERTWKWWRDAPGFSQRCTVTVAEDGRSMIGKGELSRDGSTWEKDLELTYTRSFSGGTPMVTSKQRAAARRNIKKAAKAAKQKRTVAHLPKRTRTALGKEGAKAAKRKRRRS